LRDCADVMRMNDAVMRTVNGWLLLRCGALQK
jgi:hypothetical protein